MTKKLPLFLILCFLFTKHSFSQNLAWLSTSNTSNNNGNYSLYGSDYINGSFFHCGDFWKDVIIEGVSFTAENNTPDGFILQTNKDGDAINFMHFKSKEYVRINDIVINEKTGSIIATGNYNENMSYDGQQWSSDYLTVGFIMSLKEDGDLEWIQFVEPTNNVSFGIGQSIAVDEDGNIYVGIDAGGIVSIDETEYAFGEETNGAIIVKMNQDGDVLQGIDWQNNSFEGFIDITSLAFNGDGDLLIGGSATGEVNFGGTPHTFSSVTTECFIIKQDSNLDVLKFITYPSFRCHILDIYTNENTTYLSIQYNQSIKIADETYTGSGSWGDMAIVSLNNQEGVNWVRNFKLTANEGINGVYGLDITEWKNEIFIGGLYQGDVELNDEIILDNTINGSYYQYPFLISLTPEGDLQSVHDFKGNTYAGTMRCVTASSTHLSIAGTYIGDLVLGDTLVSSSTEAIYMGAFNDPLSQVNQVASDEFVRIMPSLTSDFVTIASSLAVDKIQVYNMQGALVLEVKGDVEKIDVQHWQAGNYTMTIFLDNQLIHKRFVKF